MKPALLVFPWGGVPCHLERAICFNGQLTWRDAIGADPGQWPALDAEMAWAIGRLGRLLAPLSLPARRFDRRKRPTIAIDKWWDPSDAAWQHGRRALIRSPALSPTEITRTLRPGPLHLAIRGCGQVEVLLPRGTRSPRPAADSP